MKSQPYIPLVTTIKERCRVCYTCVRECPAKAIRIVTGQAEVVPERCVGCGNCVRVCSQRAKQVLSSIPRVEELLAGPRKVAACIAPSFAAEFTECDYRQLVGMLRAMGFAFVNEVAFGADLVADRYRKLLAEGKGKKYIATTCPAIVAYAERYHPKIVPHLAPIVSPMIASARAIRRLHGPDVRMVFIGPCIAKKGEAASENLPGEIDAALTFRELREMFQARHISPQAAAASEFDGPQGGSGALFSISRGLLQAADIREDLLEGGVVATDGRRNFVEALREFADGDLDANLLEILCCEGCIMGAGMTTDWPLFSRRAKVSQYVRQRLDKLDVARWKKDVESFADMDLARQFASDDQRIAAPMDEEIDTILARMGKFKPDDELNCGACGYDSCRDHAMAIYRGLAESEMCLPYTIEQLKKTVKELASSSDQLASAQEALMQSEKLASMGQLAAGIAHEVNNPLGVVLMYSHLLLEDPSADAKLKDDLAVIAREADRCKKIVAGLLGFARQNKVNLQDTDLRGLIDSTVRTVNCPPNVTVRVETPTDCIDGCRAQIDRDQIVQVLTNLLTNAIAAMPNGGLLTVRVRQGAMAASSAAMPTQVGRDNEKIILEVCDTGVGIVPENLSRIFDPFFTTKPMGKGTGLGLAVAYGIVKMHRGDITVLSNTRAEAGPTGTTFTVTLPRWATT